MQLDKLLRLKALPVSLPWGLNIGAVVLLPYLPLPARLTTAVLPAIDTGPGDDSRALAGLVEENMQAALTAMSR